jgi:hypothetical protein
MYPIKKVYYNDDLWKMIESFIKCKKCNYLLKDHNELCNSCEIKKREKEFEEFYMSMLL